MDKHGGDIYTYKNCTDFSASINPLGMPKAVAAAAAEALGRSVHYPDPACREVKAALSRREGVAEAQIFCGSGAADVLFSLVMAKKPKQALLPIPAFSEYARALAAVGCGIRYFPLKKEENFVLTEELLPAITPDCDILFLCNPNNPTGVLTKRALLEKILRRCEETETLLVLDECFLELTEAPFDYTLLPFIKEHPRLFLLKAFTKSHAMPGLRFGYGLCADEALLQKMEDGARPWRVSLPAQAAALAAAGEEAYLHKSRIFLSRERERLAAGLKALGFEVLPSGANFLLFSVRGIMKNDADGRKNAGNPAKILLEKQILIRSCEEMPGLGAGYFRIAVRTAEENEQLLEALAQWQKQL